MKEIKRVDGPYWTNSPRRQRFVNLVYTDGTRKTTSYARYLLEQALGRELTASEDADHIDDDPTNDAISNLRVLSTTENRGRGNPEPEYIEFNCPTCGKLARKLARKVRHNRKQGKAGPFCGKSCAAKARVVEVR